MKKTKPKIKSSWDYLKPQNLKALKDCNIIYKDAKAFYDKKEYRKAKEHYLKFLEINTADFDTLIEIGICCHELHQKRKSLHYLLRAQELRSGSTLLKSSLYKVYAANKDWKNALDYLELLNGRLKLSQIQKLRKETDLPKRFK